MPRPDRPVGRVGAVSTPSGRSGRSCAARARVELGRCEYGLDAEDRRHGGRRVHTLAMGDLALRGGATKNRPRSRNARALHGPEAGRRANRSREAGTGGNEELSLSSSRRPPVEDHNRLPEPCRRSSLAGHHGDGKRRARLGVTWPSTRTTGCSARKRRQQRSAARASTVSTLSRNACTAPRWRGNARAHRPRSPPLRPWRAAPRAVRCWRPRPPRCCRPSACREEVHGRRAMNPATKSEAGLS